MDTEERLKTSMYNADLVTLFRILIENIIDYGRWLYVIFWHELSLDKRVRTSPYVPPPENEIKMKRSDVVYYRYLRISLLVAHISSVISVYCCIRGQIKIQTILFVVLLIILSAFGIICGAHRLWCHNTYKANWPLRLFLMLCQSLALQYSIYNWVRDHRLHHKHSDTALDPHDSNRGFFFSHIGWLLIDRTPEAKKELKKIWMEDLKKDEIVMFQRRHYWTIALSLCFPLPTFVSWYFWNEHIFYAFITASYLRAVLLWHMTFTVNSIAHAWGVKPFDASVKPVDSKIVWFTSLGGEGWHNYHHAFPWDYKTSELWGYRTGLGTIFIEFCARMGWAYDLKTTPLEVQIRRRKRTGDLSCNVFGWNDSNVDPEDRRSTEIRYKKPSKNE